MHKINIEILINFNIFIKHIFILHIISYDTEHILIIFVFF